MGLLIIIIAVVFFIPGVLGASLNDACFTGDCHNSTGPKIDRALYDSNPHKIINCIDCHVNSTDNSSSEHGQFIRQLNGSNITGPLTTKYYSQNFSLCYACHNETQVVGVLSSYPNLALHLNPPINVSSIGTNFINNFSAGFYYDSKRNYPANIHWDHLDGFRLGGDPPFTFATDNNNIDSYTSCPTCHNVHGTNYPKMTKNDLAITYGSDINGTYGYIGSTEYNNQGGDLFCNSCHDSGTQFKYYRNETKVFKDCVSCHIDNIENITDISMVNKTAFSQGAHVNISSVDGDGVVNNSDCWTCHYTLDMENRSNISQCKDCHTGNGTLEAPAAPKITSHLSDKTNYSCADCHSKVIIDPGAGSVTITSHYLTRPIVPNPNYCDYCHGPNATSPFPANNKTIPDFSHDDPAWNGNATCRTCHSNSSVTADLLANDSSSFHDLTTELGDAFNGTVKADCVVCHIQKDPQFVTAVDLPLLHPDTSGMVANDCYVCHGIGLTQPQKLHSVEPGCIACHSNNTSRYYVNISLFGRHANTDTTNGLNNISDEDCKTCHFGSANDSMAMELGAANETNTYFCQDCHTSSGRNLAQYNNMTPTLRKMPMPPGHGTNNCPQCHIPGFDKPRPLTEKIRYHTHGPKGYVD